MNEEKYWSTIFIFKKPLDLKNDNANNITSGKEMNKRYAQVKKKTNKRY